MPDMDALPGDGDGPTPDADPRVAAAVHLLHHRRIWGWILAGSVIGLAAGIAARIVASHGAPAVVSGIALAAFIVLGVVALVVIIVETSRWWLRVDPLVRAQVRRRMTHHSLAGQALGISGHVLARLFLWLLVAAWMAFAVLLVPAVVNSVAYLAHAGPTATFVAQSYTQECGRGGCYYVTNGVLLTHPPASVTWPDDVPLNSTFPVRRPVWGIFGYSSDLLNGPDSGFTIGAGVVVDGLAVLIITLIVREWRRQARARQQIPDAQTASGERYPAWLLRRYHS
jgi:hypothetical protein